MKSYKHLVLLGFVCQGLTSESLVLSGLFVLLGLLASRWPGKRPIVGETVEALLFLGGLVLAWRYSRRHDYPLFITLGYPLLLLQLVRLTGAVDYRKKVIAVVIALVHLAIGSQAVFDYKFVLLLLAGLVLIPRALRELEADRFQAAAALDLRRESWPPWP